MKKFLVLAAFALCLAACQNDGGGAKYRSSEVEAFAGGVFFVEIETTQDNGSSWNITNADNLKYVKLTSIENITQKTGGKPPIQRFEFSVNKDASGKTEILRFSYFRPSETDVIAAEQKTYTVNIK